MRPSHLDYYLDELIQRVSSQAGVSWLFSQSVTRGLPPARIEAFHSAVDEMASDNTFRGYGPEQGYPFLREKIARHDFQERDADISAAFIFLSVVVIISSYYRIKKATEKEHQNAFLAEGQN